MSPRCQGRGASWPRVPEPCSSLCQAVSCLVQRVQAGSPRLPTQPSRPPCSQASASLPRNTLAARMGPALFKQPFGSEGSSPFLGHVGRDGSKACSYRMNCSKVVTGQEFNQMSRSRFLF